MGKGNWLDPMDTKGPWERNCCWEWDGIGMVINVMQMKLTFSQWQFHHRHVICNSEF